MFTFGQILDEVAPSIGTGFTAESPNARRLVRRAIQRIFIVCPILLEKRVTLYAYGDTLVLPEDIRRIKKYRINGLIQRPHTTMFEFIENGSGLAEDGWFPNSTLIDRGYSPVVYQPPSSLSLQVVSDRYEPDCILTVRGTVDGIEVRSANGTAGESIQIATGNQLITSRSSFDTITSFIKPVTKGYVHLYALGEDDEKYYLARYSPATTAGAFRTYRIPGYNFDSDDTAQLTEVQAAVIMREPQMVSDDDVIPFGDMAAIEAMARSLDLVAKGKYQEAKIEAGAGLEMARQSVALDNPGLSIPDIDGSTFMIGGEDFDV